MNMIAHIRKMDNTAQPLAEHCRTVGALCAKAGRKIGLEKTAQLIGLMHDMGKATADFAAYFMTASARLHRRTTMRRPGQYTHIAAGF